MMPVSRSGSPSRLQVRHAVDVHTDLAGSVTAQHGAILNQDGLRSVAGGRHGGADASQTAANHGHVILKGLLSQGQTCGSYAKRLPLVRCPFALRIRGGSRLAGR